MSLLRRCVIMLLKGHYKTCGKGGGTLHSTGYKTHLDIALGQNINMVSLLSRVNYFLPFTLGRTMVEYMVVYVRLMKSTMAD
ncbi:hypothetical protein DEO72_LG3g2226 [Vigna unguiculata]|uniref:Uncharacterized protein n=1 Tax=Vigna unguiculata TaxID=3917 RepID=A0A4D6LH26_VIGUN|nr:hypothetical protein DEO72_LG3g2226 [Vigna unguiculata]